MQYIAQSITLNTRQFLFNELLVRFNLCIFGFSRSILFARGIGTVLVKITTRRPPTVQLLCFVLPYASMLGNLVHIYVPFVLNGDIGQKVTMFLLVSSRVFLHLILLFDTSAFPVPQITVPQQSLCFSLDSLCRPCSNMVGADRIARPCCKDNFHKM
jgi:hypothetical protein